MADLSETLRKCRGIARPRLAQPHATVLEAASELTILTISLAMNAVKRPTNAQEEAAIASCAFADGEFFVKRD
jgi:hypothetical protein